MAYSSWSVVFGEQPSASKWNILGTNDASFNDGTGIGAGAITPAKLLAATGSTWVWQSWAPTYTNWTAGNGTTAAKYIQIGKTVFYRLEFTFGTTSSFGTGPTFTLPVTAVAHLGQYKNIIGTGSGFDVSGATYVICFVGYDSTTTGNLLAAVTSGSFGALQAYSPTVPLGVAFATGDTLGLTGTYEAA